MQQNTFTKRVTVLRSCEEGITIRFAKFDGITLIQNSEWIQNLTWNNVHDS